jgi:HSP20 family protein
MPPRSISQSAAQDHLGDALEAYLDEFMGRGHAVGFSATPKWRPPTDVFETADAVHVVMDLAGMSAESISIEVEGEMLTVCGTRPDRARGKRHYHAMEIQVGPFERRIRIGRRVDTAAIEAAYDHGYLEIRLPKTAERPAGRRQIPIR